ncbi:hypothetical protein [Halothermothrix orenii]|nr:hypothetical protein [Halothermothrix orenii]
MSDNSNEKVIFPGVLMIRLILPESNNSFNGACRRLKEEDSVSSIFIFN